MYMYATLYIILFKRYHIIAINLIYIVFVFSFIKPVTAITRAPLFNSPMIHCR